MKKRAVRIRKVEKKRVLPLAFNTVDAAKYVGCSESMLRKLRSNDDGPKSRQIGKKIVYLRSDLKEWLEAK